MDTDDVILRAPAHFTARAGEASGLQLALRPEERGSTWALRVALREPHPHLHERRPSFLSWAQISACYDPSCMVGRRELNKSLQPVALGMRQAYLDNDVIGTGAGVRKCARTKDAAVDVASAGGGGECASTSSAKCSSSRATAYMPFVSCANMSRPRPCLSAD